jgi:hypothetical protein
MVNQTSGVPYCDTILEEAIVNVNQSIVIEKHLLQKAKYIAENLRALGSTNGAINDIIPQIKELQMIMHNKLQSTEKLFQKFGNLYKNDDSIEKPSPELDTFDEDDELEE